ncbi:twin-arginine translocase TatA/TatE family subunit [Aurantiacibacter luteus]|uniref:Sec-independent protein translocase protein TatA n=1 Tax=Aurantiacibacter luteus TaxID=1581420 RepID=A0A0G9MSV5_9SPHN|nr:twin-arginine translocase TatA/TatE family subunit [Aurantiacibacter luteus]KLE33795.1 preprotein translocase subunit TatA [Aurantiacibacter luteus]
MQPGIWQILIVAIVVLVLFGRGRISEMMGDFGKGISSFKQGMNEETRKPSESSARIEPPASAPASSAAPASTESGEVSPVDRTAN